MMPNLSPVSEIEIKIAINGIKDNEKLTSMIVLDAFCRQDNNNLQLKIAQYMYEKETSLSAKKLYGIVLAFEEWQILNSISDDVLDLFLALVQRRILGGDVDDANWINLIFKILLQSYSLKRLKTLIYLAGAKHPMHEECFNSYLKVVTNYLNMAKQIDGDYDNLIEDFIDRLNKFSIKDKSNETIINKTIAVLKANKYKYRKNLILLIHGLGGSAEETWARFPELLRNDNDLIEASYDVDSFNYPTGFWSIPFFGKKACDIKMLADGLKTSIKIKYNNYTEIVLVGHSLGGLVARQYLINEVKAQMPTKIRRIIYFATPHQGSDLANIAKLISWRNNQLKQLCKNSDFINQINDDWVHLKMKEKKKELFIEGGQDRVVSSRSAKGGEVYENIATLLGKSHQNIVKPESNTDESFLTLKNFILGLYS